MSNVLSFAAAAPGRAKNSMSSPAPKTGRRLVRGTSDGFSLFGMPEMIQPTGTDCRMPRRRFQR